MDHSVAVTALNQYGPDLSTRAKGLDILRKNLDSAASKSLIADTTNSIFSDDNPPISATVASS